MSRRSAVLYDAADLGIASDVAHVDQAGEDHMQLLHASSCLVPSGSLGARRGSAPGRAVDVPTVAPPLRARTCAGTTLPPGVVPVLPVNKRVTAVKKNKTIVRVSFSARPLSIRNSLASPLRLVGPPVIACAPGQVLFAVTAGSALLISALAHLQASCLCNGTHCARAAAPA